VIVQLGVRQTCVAQGKAKLYNHLI